MNLKFMGRVSKRERAIRPFVIVKNKLMSAPVGEKRCVTTLITAAEETNRLVDPQLLRQCYDEIYDQ